MTLSFDVFVTAIEGGINYWAEVITYRHLEGEEGWQAVVIDRESDENLPHRIDQEVITRGIERAVGNVVNGYHATAVNNLHRSLLGLTDDADYDADTADMIVQFGLFGEVIYG